jgi:hypothetical protein
MFKKLMMIGLLSISFLALLGTDAKAYTYKGYGGCYGTCGSYKGTWSLTGGQKPGTTTTFLIGKFSLDTGALVCLTPGNQRDVRGGVGGTTPITAISSEDELNFDRRGLITLEQHVLSRVSEFNAFCDPTQEGGAPQECFRCGTSGDQLCTGQQLFELIYDVTSADCRNPNWLPLEYLWGNHLAEGTIGSDCTRNPDGTLTCATVQDNVTYSCTTDVSFKNYKGTVKFSCTCVENCDQGIK